MPQLVMSKAQIEAACKDIGTKLSKELKHEKRFPIIVGTMKGALNFMMDLIKYITVDCYTDFLQVSSYNGTKTTGKVILKRDLDIDVKDRTIVLVEDVIDTGISMNYLLQFLKDRYKAKRILVVTLFDKRFSRKMPVQIDYVGKVLEKDQFLYGYGLDFYEVGRNIPEVYTLSHDEILDLLAKIEED